MRKPAHKKAAFPRDIVDLERVRTMTDEEVMATSPPELADLPDDFWDNAVMMPPVTKEAISLRVDDDTLAWFRAGGPGYQTRMNAVLRSYMERMKALGSRRKKGR